ncbi:unnamed protein product [Rhodiola kirilowii]
MFFHFTAAFGFRNFQVPRQHAGRKLASDDNPGFISIDCGATEEYTDRVSGLFYHTDDGFIDTGTNHQIPSSVATTREQLRTLRSFPEGTKNCYTLKPKQGKDNVYMIRPTFVYGNYDGKNQTPTFDLYVGAIRWFTVTLSAPNEFENWCEITHVPSTNYISFCLVNTNQGVPFISALELRHMPNSIYQVGSDAVVLFERSDTGSPTNTLQRYKDDAYDRVWQPQMLPSFMTWNIRLTTTSTIDVVNSDNLYKPPPEMLQTAAQTQNASIPLNYYKTPGGIFLYYAYFHFPEIEELQPGKKREMVIYSNGTTLHEPFTLDYLKPRTVGPIKLPLVGDQISFSIGATKGSDLPPILNGYEIFRAFELQGTPTNSEDIDAIMDIKMAYGITKNWQGDPCVDTSWNGLNCSGSNYPRIISLNLSNSGLLGRIAASISNLTVLQILDLSNNDLTGPLPTFLSELPSLKVLDLSGNDFTGLIPEALMGKSTNGTLSLRLDRNPNLCRSVPCKRKGKSFPLIPVIAAVSILMVLVLAALSIWWKCKRSGINKDNDDDTFKSKKHEFSFSEILVMTDNLKTVIGVGGFGTVYLGTLKSSLKVAVKLLSPESDQGLKEFLQEVKLLMRVHHGNIVSLVGYCKHPKHMALIYEYMPNGNVRQQLSDLSNVFTWKNRVQIAVHAAQGLEYLHNGCKPPIIHRDLKTANILLDENMQAKIADFGLSRAFRSEDVTHISTTNAVGTPGYIDLACLDLAHFRKSSDVFSFGVILMELVTGKPAIARGTQNMHLLDWVVPQFERGDIRSIVDQRLRGNFSVDAAWKLVETAILCMHESPAQRPEINDVLAELKQCRVSKRISSGLALGNMSSRSRQGNALEFNVVDNGEMIRPSASDLSGNDFTGLIPEALMGKSANGTLSLRFLLFYRRDILEGVSVNNNDTPFKSRFSSCRLDRKPNICLSVPCKRKVTRFSLIPIIVVVYILMVLVLAALSIWWKCKRSGNKKDNDDTFKSKKHEFSFSEILVMTDNLKTVIGVGGFGKVYLGTLKSSLKVAVKLLMRVHHRNIVSLVGYCKHPKHMALIYEYMPNGTVRQQLSDLSNVLTWKNRVQIVVHTAQGCLEYLHNDCKPPIIHRDLKTANILLDENMQAKIADFGLSRAFRSDVTHISTTNAVGTPGYIDPACLGLAHFSKSSDVFSFSVMHSKPVTGKPALARCTQNMHLLDWVVPQFERGDIRSIVNQRLRGNFSVDAAWKLISGGSALGNMSSRSRQGTALEFSVVDNGEMTRPSARCLGLAHFSKSSDVFSFDVILMELATEKPALARGTQNMHLPDWVVRQFERGDIHNIVDQRLRRNFSVDAAWKLVVTAILCIHESPAQRPDINDVLAELKQCLVSERISGGLALEFSVVDSGEMTRPNVRADPTVIQLLL